MISVKDLKNFDPVEYLESDEDIAIFLDEAFKSGSAKDIVNALGIPHCKPSCRFFKLLDCRTYFSNGHRSFFAYLKAKIKRKKNLRENILGFVIYFKEGQRSNLFSSVSINCDKPRPVG